MGKMKHNHDHNSVHHDHPAYWRRAHRDWHFWIAVLFVFGALTIYVMSDDLALVPRSRPAQSHPASPSGK
jgi:hypothetical protein